MYTSSRDSAETTRMSPPLLIFFHGSPPEGGRYDGQWKDGQPANL